MFYIVDLSQDTSNVNYYLSNTLIDNIKRTIKNGKKVILYLNRRGFFSSFVCKDCSFLYKCKFCDVSLSVHNSPDRLLCHICGYQENISIKCKKCGSKNIDKVWVGTQQIENSLKSIFSDKLIYRFDVDNLKNKSLKEEALEKLNKADIIVWTKMITTGFDFYSVGLIWVVLLEQGLSIPRYDVEENLYLNIRQLIGRWERRGEDTNIILQTFISWNDIVESIWKGNYKDFFIKTLKERKMFNYPPFCDMVILEYRDGNKDKAEEFIKRLKNKLDILNVDKTFDIILFPETQKKHNSYYFNIVVKWQNVREFLDNIKIEIMRNSKLVVIFE